MMFCVNKSLLSIQRSSRGINHWRFWFLNENFAGVQCTLHSESLTQKRLHKPKLRLQKSLNKPKLKFCDKINFLSPSYTSKLNPLMFPRKSSFFSLSKLTKKLALASPHKMLSNSFSTRLNTRLKKLIKWTPDSICNPMM